MTTGIVFEIEEFAVHDGPGIRTTVFLKGCPLRCSWCHNPEGIAPGIQVLRSRTDERIVGRSYTVGELAEQLNRQAGILRANQGGVTFSGGEPLAQAAFVAAVIDRLDHLHVLLDTSGFAPEADFRQVAAKASLVHFDLKLIDAAMHRRYTGADNDSILRNLGVLSTLGVPFVVRVPLVPGVTDTDENLAAIARTVRSLAGLVRVELLPYNRAAGGKYRACGLDFHPGFDESLPVNANLAVFTAAGIEARVA